MIADLNTSITITELKTAADKMNEEQLKNVVKALLAGKSARDKVNETMTYSIDMYKGLIKQYKESSPENV